MSAYIHSAKYLQIIWYKEEVEVKESFKKRFLINSGFSLLLFLFLLQMLLLLRQHNTLSGITRQKEVHRTLLYVCTRVYALQSRNSQCRSLEFATLSKWIRVFCCLLRVCSLHTKQLCIKFFKSIIIIVIAYYSFFLLLF